MITLMVMVARTVLRRTSHCKAVAIMLLPLQLSLLLSLLRLATAAVAIAMYCSSQQGTRSLSSCQPSSGGEWCGRQVAHVTVATVAPGLKVFWSSLSWRFSSQLLMDR